jgi:hypothetical protein
MTSNGINETFTRNDNTTYNDIICSHHDSNNATDVLKNTTDHHDDHLRHRNDQHWVTYICIVIVLLIILILYYDTVETCLKWTFARRHGWVDPNVSEQAVIEKEIARVQFWMKRIQ